MSIIVGGGRYEEINKKVNQRDSVSYETENIFRARGWPKV